MPYAELVFISAKTGLRISRMFETIDAVIENQTLRIQTGVLNEILSEAVAMQQPPSDKGKRLKIYYKNHPVSITQCPHSNQIKLYQIYQSHSYNK